MDPKKRKEVEDLIFHLLSEQKVLGCSMKCLDSGGMHFSSDVYEVQLQLENKDGSRPLLHLIVKLMPARDQQIENNSKLGFIKEIAFYKHAIPEYIQIQEKHGFEVNNFPKLFEASNDIIILRDLRCLQYTAWKHRLDEEHTKLVLRELAKFHATGVALKFFKPGFFQSNMAEVVTPALRNATNVNRAEINNSLRREVSILVKSMVGFESIADSVDLIIQTIDNEQLPAPREPYATLLHNDLWRGNILFRYSSVNHPIGAAFIDFQNTIYNSPARDLVYFLFTSVDKQVLLDFDSIILYYYQTFVSCLSVFGCDTSEFTLTKLMDEIHFYGPKKLKHMILLSKVLSGSNQNYDVSFKIHLEHIFTLFKDRCWL